MSSEQASAIIGQPVDRQPSSVTRTGDQAGALITPAGDGLTAFLLFEVVDTKWATKAKD